MKTPVVQFVLVLAVAACGCGDKSKSGSNSDAKSKTGSQTSSKTGTTPNSAAAGQPTPLTAIQRMTLKNNLKQVVIAMHNHHDTFHMFPPAAGDDSGKGKGLSWRVHLLRFLGRDDLYRKFHLNEPWDSAHNRTLLAEMPNDYKTPGVDAPGMTSIRTITGPGTIMGGEKGISLSKVVDGTSNTAVVIAAGPAKAVEWTKPETLQLNSAQTPVEILGKIADKGYAVGMADAAVIMIDASLGIADLQKLFRYNDGSPDQGIFNGPMATGTGTTINARPRKTR